MMLPMIGFLFVLVVVGGLASLVATADPHAELAPFLGFPLLFAGLAALCLSFGFSILGDYLDHVLGTLSLSWLGFIGGYALGGLGGALLGIKKVLKRQ
jgi:hypothetical protein